MKVSETNHWMNLQNCLNFAFNLLQDVHCSQLSVENTKNGYNSVRFTDVELQFGVTEADSTSSERHVLLEIF